VLEKRVLYSGAIFLYIGRVFILGLGSFAVRLDWMGGMEILGGFFCRFLPFYIHLLKFLRCVGGREE